VIIAHAEQLTALDQAIGDGDHGANMARAFARSRLRRTPSAPCRWGRRCRRPAWPW
jgi:hypothetical protein